jgi:hypothetical protein
VASKEALEQTVKKGRIERNLFEDKILELKAELAKFDAKAIAQMK